jgi:hypothetical protein
MPSALAEVIRSSRDDVLARWEAGVRTLAAGARTPQRALFDEVPAFLDGLIERLDAAPGAADEGRDDFALRHGLERLAQGFDVVEVVAELALLRECLLEAWESAPAGITPREIRRLDAELDHVIAMVAVEYVRRAGAPVAGADEGPAGPR